MQDLITYAVSSIALSGGFYALFRAFLQGERAFAFNRALLNGLVALSLILPALGFTGIFTVEKAPISAPRETFTKVFAQRIDNTLEPRPAQAEYKTVSREPNRARYLVPIKQRLQEPESEFDYKLIALYLYLIIFMVLASKTVKSAYEIISMKKRGELSRFPGYTVCILNENIAPFSFMRTIYLPKGAYDERELEQIILHELAHIEQRHTLDLLFLEFVSAAAWCNPFYRLFKKSAIELHEYLADHKTLSSGVSKIDYTSTLYKNLTGEKLFASSHYLNKDQIKRRLKMMTSVPVRKFAPWKYALVISCAAILGFAFTCSEKPSQRLTKGQTKGQNMLIQFDPIALFSSKDMDHDRDFSGKGKNLKLDFPGGMEALRDTILADPIFLELSNRDDISVELLAEFKIDQNGKAIHPYETAFTEDDSQNILGKYNLDKRFINIINKFKGLAIRNDDIGGGHVRVFFKILFGGNKLNAYETLKKQPQPDVLPEFPGPEGAMEKFIASNLIIPDRVEEGNVNVKLNVSFFVEPDGSIAEPIASPSQTGARRVDENSLYECRKEACNLVRKMPKWKPAMKDGKSIRYAVSIPIMFGNEAIWNAKNNYDVEFHPIPGTKLGILPKGAYSNRPEFDYNEISSFIKANLKYPKSELNRESYGVSSATIDLTNKGEFVNPIAETGFGKVYDEEVLRVLKKLKPVKPLTDNYGRPMSYRIKTEARFSKKMKSL